MKRRGLLSTSGILVLGLIVLITLHEWDNPLDASQRQAILSAPAIIANDVNATLFSPTGEPQYRLQSDHLIQYEQHPRTLLTNPYLTIDNDEGIWTIQSRDGEVKDDNKLIVFRNDVVAHSKAQGTTLKTSKLLYYNDTGIVEAPTSVALTRPGQGTTHAGSMKVHVDSGHMQLKQGVTSEFDGPE